jgi:hypothetical protein
LPAVFSKRTVSREARRNTLTTVCSAFPDFSIADSPKRDPKPIRHDRVYYGIGVAVSETKGLPMYPRYPR